MFLGLPFPQASLQDGVIDRRSVNHVADPRMPSRLNLTRVVFLVTIVDPAGAQGQFFLKVFVVLVAVAIGAYESAGLRVPCVILGVRN